MQLLEHWDPLNLPKGSVRALVTLALLGVLWAHMALNPGNISFVFSCVVLLALGNYFGARNKKPGEEKTKSPLGLPRGSVRTIIILGFVAVSYFLWKGGKLDLSIEENVQDTGKSVNVSNVAILLLAGALIVGFLIRNFLALVLRGKAAKMHRWFENLKALLVIVATGLLCLFTFLQQDQPTTQMIAFVAAPFVCFYYGSRH